MIDVRCSNCRLIWREDRSKGDSPISPHVILCPRCGKVGDLPLKEETEKGGAMIEDKLTQMHRLRLECLNQAVASSINQTHNKTAAALVERAKIFEEYLSSETDE